MKDNYLKAIAEILKWEGGYSNNPADPGGATMRGITQAVYDAYRKRNGRAVQPVRQIADSELQSIYRFQYWDVVRGDDLPAGIDLAVFDFAVNSGPARAAKYLQMVLGVTADGHIGHVTLQTATEAEPKSVISSVCGRRLDYLKSLRTWPEFHNGWSDRVSGITAKSLAMASGSSVVALRPKPTPSIQEPVTVPRRSVWAWFTALFSKGDA